MQDPRMLSSQNALSRWLSSLDHQRHPLNASTQIIRECRWMSPLLAVAPECVASVVSRDKMYTSFWMFKKMHTSFQTSRLKKDM